MSNWLRLEGDVCAVTGALGGMGVEICREFARNGANVVLLDLDEEKVKAAAADLARRVWHPRRGLQDERHRRGRGSGRRRCHYR